MWLTGNFGKLETVDYQIVKGLLDVRTTTCSETCLFEAGMPSLKMLVNVRRKTFLLSKIPQLTDDTPLKVAIHLNKDKKTQSYISC